MMIEEVESAIIRNGVRTTQKVLALCDALWVIHPDTNLIGKFGRDPLYKLTHRPTGYAVHRGMTWTETLETFREIQSRNVDWAWTDPAVAKALSKEWKSIRAAVSKRLTGGSALTPA